MSIIKYNLFLPKVGYRDFFTVGRITANRTSSKTQTRENHNHQSSINTVVKGEFDNLTAYKRGKGGRASFSGIVATVFGANGFIGRYVVNRLGRVGSQVICPYRGDPYFMKDLKLAGDLGQIYFLPYNLRNEDAIRKSMKYSNVVINLVGREWETKNFSYGDVHVDGARRLARLAKEAGVERFIHVSHLNAQPSPRSFYQKGGSKFLISKWLGEVAVREEFPEATIFRPADVWGPEDRFIRYFAGNFRRARGHRLPLWKKGEQTIKMPVFYSDVVEGITNAVLDPSTAGNIYQCIGPNAYKLSDLIDYFYRCMRYNNFKRIHISPLFRLKVRFLSLAPSVPIVTPDKIEWESLSDEIGDVKSLEDLGVHLTPIESRAQYELKPYQLHAYYQEAVGEFPEPMPPPIYNF